MAVSYFLKDKIFNDISIIIDTSAGMSEKIFYLCEKDTPYTSTVSLSRLPRRGLPPFFFMNEDPIVREDVRYLLPSWGSRETHVTEEKGKSFQNTRNSNFGFIGKAKSEEEGELKEPIVLEGLSLQKIKTDIYYIKGNFKEYTLDIYKELSDFLLNKDPLVTLNTPPSSEEGYIELEREIQFEFFVLTIKNLKEANLMPKIELLRFHAVHELTGEEVENFSLTQEVKGDEFATGIALKSCEFVFTDKDRLYDKQNPSSPFYRIDLRNFLIIPRVDCFREGNFMELEGSFPLGEFYGEPLDESQGIYSAKLKGHTKLKTLKDMKTARHYYHKASLKEVFEDLFADVKTPVLVEDYLKNEIILYDFFGGGKLEDSLKTILNKYNLIVYETLNSEIQICNIHSSAIHQPDAFFNLSNTFKYQIGSMDKVVNKLVVKNVKNTLSDEDLNRYWVKRMIPSFDGNGNMITEVKEIEMNDVLQKVKVITDATEFLSLPRLLEMTNTKNRVYPARNSNTPKPTPTLRYNVLVEQDFDEKKDTYIKDIILSKNNSPESQPSYLEFEWWAYDCFYQGIPSTLITVDIWVYYESAYEYVKYERTYGDVLKYVDGYAVVAERVVEREGKKITELDLDKYRANEQDASILYGEVQITPPTDQRTKKLKTETIQMKSSRGRIKEINDETKEKAELMVIEASSGHLWDRIESDLILPENSERWLWVDQKVLGDRIEIRYINLSASEKSFDIDIFGREFIKKELGQKTYENLKSLVVYGEKEGEIENLDEERIEQYLNFHSRPWETVALEVKGNPSIMAGKTIQYMSEYDVLARGQVIKNIFKMDKGGVMTSTLTTIKFPFNDFDKLGAGSMGVIGEIDLRER